MLGLAMLSLGGMYCAVVMYIQRVQAPAPCGAH
jgi:hypothetical protein